MFKSVAGRARAVVTTGLIAALVVAGLAVAQGGNGGGKSGHRKAHSGKRMPPPPGGPLGKVGKDLTYGQLHVQREGKAETIRIDAGEVVSTSESSITVKENDGNEVTVSVDGETKVLAGPGKRGASVTDLEAGQHVIVCGPEGEAAKTVAVPPKRGGMPRGQHGSRQGGPQGQMPPPPAGGQFGGPEGGPGQMQG